ncbi:MAG: efflux RND transporter periplasmic adaptor subunit [Bacteroidetes bacterium]|nr:efflux RND transporter periplasmic adaptor subunit [Bacteroidota bacterium]
MKNIINNLIYNVVKALKGSIFTLLVFSLFFTSCGNKESAAHEEDEHGHGGGASHENALTASLTAEQIQSIGIQLGNIEKKQLTSSLRANGILKVPNQNRATITAMAGGVIRTILVQPGNVVTKGQIIATIAGTAFITMQEEFIAISAKAQLSEIDYSRQKELQAGNATSLKSLQQSESELTTLRARKSSLQKQLELIGVNASNLTSDNIQSAISILSPISGSVGDVMVNIGSFVETNNPIATVVDNSQLHLDLYVYEKDLIKLKEGQTIHFTLTNNPGKEYDAKIYAISNTFETNTKAVSVHAQVLGDKSGLIDGMSITAIVSLNEAAVNAVPADAIVNFEGQDFIFVVTDAHSDEEHHDEADGHAHDAHGHEHKENEIAHSEEEHVHKEGEVHAHDEGDNHTHEAGENQHETEQSTEGTLTFERIPVAKGTTDIGYSEITLLKDIPANARIVTKGAFFVLGKMTNAGEGHQH